MVAVGIVCFIYRKPLAKLLGLNKTLPKTEGEIAKGVEKGVDNVPSSNYHGPSIRSTVPPPPPPPPPAGRHKKIKIVRKLPYELKRPEIGNDFMYNKSRVIEDSAAIDGLNKQIAEKLGENSFNNLKKKGEFKQLLYGEKPAEEIWFEDLVRHRNLQPQSEPIQPKQFPVVVPGANPTGDVGKTPAIPKGTPVKPKPAPKKQPPIKPEVTPPHNT